MRVIEEEAKRLAARFQGVRNREEFAKTFGIKGRGAMIYQHVNGLKPISLEAGIAYARGFGCSLEEISPRLAKIVSLIISSVKSEAVESDWRVDDARRTPFGGRLVKAREAAGLTQEEVAKAIGMSQGTLAEAEVAGKRSGYTPELAALYKVNPVWLATGKGLMQKDDTPPEMSNEHRLLIDAFNCAPKAGRAVLLSVADTLLREHYKKTGA